MRDTDKPLDNNIYTPTRLHRLCTALLVAWIVGGSAMLLVLGLLMSWAR